MKNVIKKVSVGLVASMVVSSAMRAQDTNSMKQLVQANNRFALDLFRQVGSNATDNSFFSPYSISTALAMTWAGAKGETAAQMAKAFHFSELPEAAVTPGFTSLQAALAQAQAATGSQLSVANSLWPEQNPELPFLPQYLQSVQRDFASELTPVDFKHQPEAAAAQINKWVADKTHDKIKDILKPKDLKSDTRLALVNAIYFKGSWAEPFEARFTATQAFHTASGSTSQAPLMRHTFEAYQASYLDLSNSPVPCQLLALNYFERDSRGGGRAGRFFRGVGSGPGVSMLIVLLRSPSDLIKLEKNLTADQLAGWIGRMADTRVEVFLPKFKIEQRFDLGKNLQALGATDAFADPGLPNGADFSGMNGQRFLYISKVIHQSFINVDESGTEAAAATVVGMAAGSAMRPAPPPVFRADRPFLFFIREDTTGSILFMGRLADPAATKAG